MQITKAPAGIETFTKSYDAGDLDFDAIISTASGGRLDMLATGDIAASVYDAPMVMFVNNKLMSDYNITDNIFCWRVFLSDLSGYPVISQCPIWGTGYTTMDAVRVQQL